MQTKGDGQRDEAGKSESEDDIDIGSESLSMSEDDIDGHVYPIPTLTCLCSIW